MRNFSGNRFLKLFAILVLFASFFGAESLRCRHCFWSDSRETADDLQEKLKVKGRTYPVPDPPSVLEVEDPPSRKDIEGRCGEVACRAAESSCLIWSYRSGSKPKNMTLMCVGNPGQRKGCFQQDLQGLKVEVCLCNEDLCNSAESLHKCEAVLLFILVFQYILKIR